MTSKIKCRTFKHGLPAFSYAQVKLDGIWLRVEHGRALTSHPTDVTERLTHHDWWGHAQRMCDATGCVILGELCAPGRPASQVKSAMARGESLELIMFALEHALIDAEASLESVESMARYYSLPFAPFARGQFSSIVAAQHALDCKYRAPGECLDEYRGHRVEGLVFKRGNLADWHKWKPVRTIDCVVTAFTDGRGKYEGLPGSLECSIEGRVVCDVSGMDDDTRELLVPGDIGRVCEVMYQYVGSAGRLRHPRFVRWRDDKSPDECLLSQDPELE